MRRHLARCLDDFHRLLAQILTRLGRREEASAAATRYELSQAQELQQLKFPLFSAAPTFVRQRFLLQKECRVDDRHVLSLRLDRGRVSVTPSYAGTAGTMTVEETDDMLLFVMGAEPCQVRVIVGMGDLLIDTPRGRNDSLRKSLGRQSGALDIEREFHRSSTYGCASGSATVRVYWGSVDDSYFVHQAASISRTHNTANTCSTRDRSVSRLAGSACRPGRVPISQDLPRFRSEKGGWSRSGSRVGS
jgi:hypothetical protein